MGQPRTFRHTERRSRPRRLMGRDDDGQAGILLLFALTLAMLALTVLFVRVGAANDMRSQAQTAADATALAAVGAIQDSAAEDLVNGVFPMPVFDEDAARSRAEEYARANGAVLTDLRASDNALGRNGNIVRVEVRGALCQKELEEDGSRAWNDVVCDDEDETATTVGNASAIAIVHGPTQCQNSGNGFSCEGNAIDDIATARNMIDVNLIDQEGEYAFNPKAVVFAGGAVTDCASLGQVHPIMCSVHEILNEEFGKFYLNAGGYRHLDPGDHGRGHAVDYMVAEIGGVPTDEMHQSALVVANWLIQNASELGVKGLIYNRTIWNIDVDSVGSFPDQVGRPHGTTADNTQGHVDHIHVSAGPGRMR